MVELNGKLLEAEARVSAHRGYANAAAAEARATVGEAAAAAAADLTAGNFPIGESLIVTIGRKLKAV